jgi:hypothetical protein
MSMLKKLAWGLLGVLLPMPALAADDKATVPPGGSITVNVKAATPEAPKVTLKLTNRKGHATPIREKCNKTGGGNIVVAQATEDTITVTLSGAAVAYCGAAGFDFDFDQCFEVVYADESVKAAKLTATGQVIGVLRSSCKGGSAEENGSASVVSGGNGLLSLTMPGHTVAGGENLSVNDYEGPLYVGIGPGTYTLHQCWHISAVAPKCLFPCKAPSVEFADGALDPLWLSYKEPFHGIAKKDFGFQVTLKVEPVDAPVATPAPAPAPAVLPAK